MPLSMGDLAGLGYSGFARVGGYDLLLLPSSGEERDNLIVSASAPSTSFSSGVGRVPVRDRRSLQLSLTAQLTQNSLLAFYNTTLAWRRVGSLDGAQPAFAFFAHGEGFSTSFAYVDSAALSMPEAGLGTVSFQLTSWVWEPTVSGGNYLTAGGSGFDPEGSQHQPIPHWCTVVEHTGQPGVAVSWDLTLNNGWQYTQLLEGALLPPNPRVILPSPLDASLNLTTLAQPGVRPSESGAAVIQVLNLPAGNNNTPSFVLNIPFMVRDPGHSTVGMGEQNSVIRRQGSWKALGLMPG